VHLPHRARAALPREDVLRRRIVVCHKHKWRRVGRAGVVALNSRILSSRYCPPAHVFLFFASDQLSLQRGKLRLIACVSG